MERLYVFYDARCGFCRWVKHWAQDQPALLPLVFVAAGSAEAERLVPGIGRSDPPDELIAVSDDGRVYRDDSAWIMCFYALEAYREWSCRLASPAMRPLARKAFALLSRHRVRVSDWLGLSDQDAIQVFDRVEAPACQVAASGLRSIHEMLAEAPARPGNQGTRTG